MSATVSEDLRQRPIPLRAEGAASAHDYHDVEIEHDSKFSNEPLVPVSEYGLASESYYARKDGFNAPYYKHYKSASKHVHLRRTVVEKLLTVNKSLEHYNVELYLLDGYRPIALQVEIFEDMVELARRVLDNPTEEECFHHAGYYVSDPRGFDEKNFRTWPVHSSGGAVDISLRSHETRQELFFGSIFDDPSDVTHTDHFERNISPTDGASIIEARRNRRLLYWSMINAGFTNYAYEWWHYDWGTQMYVANNQTNEKHKAYYGYVKTPASF